MKKIILATLSLIIGILAISQPVLAKDRIKATDITNTFTSEFDYHDLSKFYMSDGWTNGGGFDCIWRKDNIKFNEGILSLTIDEDKPNSDFNYSGAEYATNGIYHYGYYAVEMKPIKNDGVVSSFFTYAGSGDGTLAHEIDIEFLGKNTNEVQFNYFYEGAGGREKVYDLGFDAAKEFHEYSFLWLKDSITWYVDGVEAYKATYNIPSKAGHIMMNVWPGKNLDGWLNAYDGKTPLTSEYQWIKYVEDYNEADINLDGQVDLIDLSLLGTMYNISLSDKNYNGRYDLNKDGIVDIYDFVNVAKRL